LVIVLVLLRLFITITVIIIIIVTIIIITIIIVVVIITIIIVVVIIVIIDIIAIIVVIVIIINLIMLGVLWQQAAGNTPGCLCLHGNLIRPTVVLVWYERALTLQGLMEEHQDLAVELCGPDTVVVPIKEHELLVRAAILGNQLF